MPIVRVGATPVVEGTMTPAGTYVIDLYGDPSGIKKDWNITGGAATLQAADMGGQPPCPAQVRIKPSVAPGEGSNKSYSFGIFGADINGRTVVETLTWANTASSAAKFTSAHFLTVNRVEYTRNSGTPAPGVTDIGWMPVGQFTLPETLVSSDWQPDGQGVYIAFAPETRRETAAYRIDNGTIVIGLPAGAGATVYFATVGTPNEGDILRVQCWR